MIDQEQKRKGDQDKVFKDKYEKLKEQKQINMDLQQKMLEIKSKKLQKIKQQSEEHEADLDKPHVSSNFFVYLYKTSFKKKKSHTHSIILTKGF